MTILEPADDTLSTQVGDEIILLSMSAASPQYYGLHGAAIRIWELIETRAHGEETICNVLLEEFDGAEDAIRQDVAQTVRALEERNLIRRQ